MLIEILTIMLLIAASIRDIRKRELARWMLAGAGALSAAVCLGVCRAGAAPADVRELAVSFLPGAALLAAAFLLRGGIGYGDGLFMMLLGPVFGGGRMAAGICLAFFFCALCSAILLCLRRVGRKSALPFIPFLASGVEVMRFVLQ